MKLTLAQLAAKSSPQDITRQAQQERDLTTTSQHKTTENECENQKKESDHPQRRVLSLTKEETHIPPPPQTLPICGKEGRESRWAWKSDLAVSPRWRRRTIRPPPRTRRGGGGSRDGGGRDYRAAPGRDSNSYTSMRAIGNHYIFCGAFYREKIFYITSLLINKKYINKLFKIPSFKINIKKTVTLVRSLGHCPSRPR